MSNKVLTASKIARILEQLGFTEVRGAGSHLVLKHPSTGLMLSIPQTGGKLSPVHLRTVESQLLNFHIVSEQKWNQMLRRNAHD